MSIRFFLTSCWALESSMDTNAECYSAWLIPDESSIWCLKHERLHDWFVESNDECIDGRLSSLTSLTSFIAFHWKTFLERLSSLHGLKKTDWQIFFSVGDFLWNALFMHAAVLWPWYMLNIPCRRWGSCGWVLLIPRWFWWCAGDTWTFSLPLTSLPRSWGRWIVVF